MSDEDPKAHDHLGALEDTIEYGEELLRDPRCNATSEAVLRLLGEKKAKPSELVHVVSTLCSVLYNYTDYTFGEILDMAIANAGDDERRDALEQRLVKCGFEVRNICVGCEHKRRNMPSA